MHLVEYLCKPKRGDYLAITITQCQRTKCVWRSPNETFVVDSGRFVDENGPARSKFCGDSATVKQTRTEIPTTLPHAYRNYIESYRVQDRILAL